MKANHKWTAVVCLLAVLSVMLSPTSFAAPVEADMNEELTGPFDNGVYKEIIEVTPGSSYQYRTQIIDLNNASGDAFYVYLLLPLQNIIDQQMEGSTTSAPLEYAPTLTEISVSGLVSAADLGVAYSTYYIDFSVSGDPMASETNLWDTTTLAELKGMDDITVIRLDFSEYLTTATGPSPQIRATQGEPADDVVSVSITFKVPTMTQADNMRIESGRDLYQYYYAVYGDDGSFTTSVSDIMPTARLRNDNPNMGADSMLWQRITISLLFALSGVALIVKRRLATSGR